MDSGQAKAERRAAERSYSFGYLLRRLRLARDLTQEELAEGAGCTANTIHKIETDLRRPSRTLAERLAAALALAGAERGAFIRSARAAMSPDQLPLPVRPATPAAGEPAAAAPGLPAPATAFIGRERELAVLDGLLGSAGVRLITICGLGGAGKTRLALAAAGRQQALAAGRGRFANGVTFVALGGVATAAQAEAAVAAALDLALEQGPRPRRRQIVDYLRRKALLLVLDGYDLPPAEAGLLERIVEAAPAMAALVTSRDRLHLQGEHVLMLEGMALPPEAAPPGAAPPEAARYDAVRLFLQAAGQVRPGFAPAGEALADIVAICRLAEGLPLAIELAASWAALLTPGEILAELRRGDELLTTELRDVPARQRSMRAVYDASWQRLGPPERRLFARVSVFRGGFTLAAAREVAGAGLPQLAHLAERALLRHDPARDRFAIHELLRQYGAGQLARDPAEAAAAGAAHAGYYLALLARQGAELRGRGQQGALAALGEDDANLRAAWQWAVDARRADLLGPAAAGLGPYYEWLGRLHEGEEAFRAAAEALAAEDTGPEGLPLQAAMLAWHGAFSERLGAPEAAGPAIERSLALLERADPSGQGLRGERAFALWRLGRLRAAAGQADAAELYGRSLATYSALGRDWEASGVLADLGELRLDQGLYGEAERALREGRALCERGGDLRGLVQTLQMLGRCAFERGAPDEAVQLARRAAEQARALGSRVSLAAALGRLGTILMHTGAYDEAAGCLRESLAHYEDLGDELMIAMAHSRLAMVLVHLGEAEASYDHARQSVALGRRAGGLPLAQGLFALALAEEALGDAQAADLLLDEGVALCSAHGLDVTGGVMLAEQSGVAWELGDGGRARARAVAALRMAVEQHNLLILEMVLPACLEPMAAAGMAGRAAEIYGLEAGWPLWRGSRLAAPYRERILAAVNAALPPEALAAAVERGRGLERWGAARALLAELVAAGWGER